MKSLTHRGVADVPILGRSRVARRVAAMLASTLVVALPLTLQAQPAATGAASAGGQAAHGSQGASGAACTQPLLACASAVTPAFDRQGRLWLAGLAGGAVVVTVSDDRGAHFASEVVVDSPGPQLDLGADARPQIVVDADGRVVVAWGVFKDKAYNAQVRMARSDDGGRHFSAPAAVSDDPASQRFPALALAADGRLFSAWLDKRTVAAARRKGQPQSGAALAIAWAGKAGTPLDAERIAQDHTCECCRLAVALDSADRPAVLLRAIFPGGERDHQLLRWGADGAPRATRVAADRWAIDACPHHGPALAFSGDEVLHAAWFTLGAARQGLFYARSTDGGASFGAPQAVGAVQRQAGRPALLARGATVWMAWKEFDGQRLVVQARRSDDRGASWGEARELAATRGSADHPVLVSDGARDYLSWQTRQDGYRLIELETNR